MKLYLAIFIILSAVTATASTLPKQTIINIKEVLFANSGILSFTDYSNSKTGEVTSVAKILAGLPMIETSCQKVSTDANNFSFNCRIKVGPDLDLVFAGEYQCATSASPNSFGVEIDPESVHLNHVGSCGPESGSCLLAI